MDYRNSKRLFQAASVTIASVLGAGGASAAVPALPWAEGFGANATGGRGGDVYHVTTLADDPNHVIRGSLFFGLYEKNVPGSGTTSGVGRTIVFDVGGTINLGSSTLDLKNIKNVTLAGQTAPGGITIIGNTVQITSSSGKETGNIILQHVAIRKGLANSGDALSIKGSGSTHDIMVDHVSGSWSEDEVISVGGATNHATNVTVQYSTMSEALTSGHQYGALIRNNQSASVSYNHNLMSNNVSRNPRPGTYLGTQLDFEFQNNVIYNWSDRAGYTGGASESDTENVNMNYVGNYLIAGPSSVGGPTTIGGTPVIGARRNTAFTKDASNDPLNLNVYQSGNKIDWAAGATRDGQDIGWNAFANWNGTVSTAFPAADLEASRFLYPASSPDSADDAYGRVISAVGAFPFARSTTDQRLINEVLTYTGTAAQTAPNASEWTAISTAPTVARAVGYDEEDNGNYTATSWEGTQTNPQPKPKGDGMPTWWENLRGYNPLVSDNNTVTSDGYTRLEHYLHYAALIANWNSTGADGNWSDHLNWRGMRPERIDATANFVTGNASTRTVTLDMPVTLSHLNFSSGNSYVINGGSTLTLGAIDGSTEVNVTAGSHAVWAPVNLSNNLIVTAASGAGVTLSNLQPSTRTITKNGTGGLAVNNLRQSSLVVNAGTVAVLPDGSSAGSSKLTTLSISSGKLDLANNKLVVTSNSLAGITTLIASGRNGGAWNGNGIVTSQSDALSGYTSLAIATAFETGHACGTFGGTSVSASDVLVMYTYGGDANLSGSVDIDDYGQIDANASIGGTLTGWYNGDFDYSGTVDIDDYGIIDSIIGIQGAPFPTASGEGVTVAAVPEPSAACGLAALGASLLHRRKRR